MPLARPFIKVSSVLMASMRAQMRIRKCIHRGNTSAARVNRAAATSGYWNGPTEPLPTAAMPPMPIRKVNGMAMAAAPQRLRFRAAWLSTVYTRCHMPGWKALDATIPMISTMAKK